MWHPTGSYKIQVLVRHTDPGQPGTTATANLLLSQSLLSRGRGSRRTSEYVWPKLMQLWSQASRQNQHPIDPMPLGDTGYVVEHQAQEVSGAAIKCHLNLTRTFTSLRTLEASDMSKK